MEGSEDVGNSRREVTHDGGRVNNDSESSG